MRVRVRVVSASMGTAVSSTFVAETLVLTHGSCGEVERHLDEGKGEGESAGEQSGRRGILIDLCWGYFWNCLVDLSPNHHETTPQSTPAGSKNHPNPRLKVQDNLAKIEKLEKTCYYFL